MDVAARLAEWALDPAPYSAPRVSTRQVALEAEGVRFDVRVYSSGTGASPCLVWVHGGGFFAGDLDMREADTVAREVAVRAEAVVVSVDYTLVPGATYPVQHRQVVEAVRWVMDNTCDLGIGGRRVTLGGASAGAALSLAAARQLVADDAPLPAALVLAYPVAHRCCPVEPAHEALMRQLPPLLRFTPSDLERITGAYLAQHSRPRFGFVDLEPAGIEAALAGLPPALVLIAEYDDLRSSGELLIRQAAESGWPVERRLCPGMVHGHLDRTPLVAETDRSLDAIAQVVREGGIRPGSI